MKRKKINNIEEIVNEILDYEIRGNEINIYTKRHKYCINYSYENESKIFDMYKNCCNEKIEELNKQQERNTADKKLFTNALIFDIALLLLIVGFGRISIWLIFTLPSIVLAVQFINILKQVKKEKKNLISNKTEVLNNLDSKENNLIENDKKRLMEMSDEELFALAFDEIFETNIENKIEEIEEDEIDYDALENFDFEDLDEEYIDELIKLFEEDEKEKPKVKVLI